MSDYDTELHGDDGFREYEAAVAAGPVLSRRRALFDRIIGMDDVGLAAMERAADMIDGTGFDYGFRSAPVADA